jgi:HEPN domain-containing protein
MKPHEEVRRELVGQWIEKADQDLAAAEILLENAVPLKPIIAFHAQQAVEKYLKAVLVRHQVYFPKTHDIGTVLSLVAACEPAAALALQRAAVLTPFGVEVRYPGDTPELLPGEDLRAVEIARHARDVVKELLKTYLSQDC